MRLSPYAAIPLAALLAFAPSARAQGNEAAGANWRVYGGGPYHTRYSVLDQIHAGNAAELRVAWRWKTENYGPQPEVRNASTPLVIDGILYVTAGLRRSVAAIDAVTGETLWLWRAAEGERAERAPRVNSGRGVAYWTDGMGDRRILVITPGYNLVALDATTGRPVRSFGAEGVLDLMEEHRTREGVPMLGTIGASSPPLVAGDVLVVGSAHRVGMRPPSRINTPGDVRGYDVRTGKLLWTFHTIPEEGEPGVETWDEGSWRYTGNAGVWAPASYDPESGYVYLPVEAATGDLYGGHRPGDNLYSTSLVCLDGRTGAVIWHYQLVHHDIWDWDVPTAPILADLTIDDRPRKIVAQITKQAFTYVFDRITGEPIWPIEERPVPQSDVPGERTARTQPFPTKPAPFDRQGFRENDLADYTPELRTRALELTQSYRMGPLFSPPSLTRAEDGTRGTLSLPSTVGGANWEGGALDPETGMLYVGSATNPSVLSLVEGGRHSDMNYIAAAVPAPRLARGVPIVKPPWGRITAIDLTTGDHAWMVANGDTPESVAESLGLAPEEIPRTGKPTRAGLLVTKTLLLAGEGFGGDPVLRAHDKTTGEIIVQLELPASQTGHPMTYMVEGRQYIVVPVGGPGPAELVALTLP